MVLLTPLLLASIAHAAGGAASGYDDRVMIDRATKAADSVHAHWKGLAGTDADQRKAVAPHIDRLRAVVAKVGVALRSRDAPKDIVAHRRAIKSAIEKFLACAAAYGGISRSHDAMQRKLAGLKKTKPTPC
jgi:hypothetical protein